MAYTESSFGAKLKKAQDVSTFILTLDGYEPTNLLDYPLAFQTLLENIFQLNESVAEKTELYRNTVDARQLLYRNTPTSFKRALTQLRSAIKAQYGNTSSQLKDFDTINRKIRGTKLTKTPLSAQTETQQTSISVSQNSFGSLLKHFNDLIATVNTFENYQAPIDQLSIISLKEMATQMGALNTTIAQSVQQLAYLRSDRTIKYHDMKERSFRIRNYIRAKYGPESVEYKIVKDV